MKRIILGLVAALVTGLFFSAVAAPNAKNPAGTLQHVVILKFKAGTSADDIKKVEAAFAGLQKSIPQVAGLKWGTNVSPENLAKGFTHCFVLNFKSNADRDAYLVHAEHKAFGKVLGPVLEDVLVIDFWAQK